MTEPAVFRQSMRKLLRILPLAGAMAGGSGVVLAAGLSGAGIAAILAGLVGVFFFGPALFILLWAFVRPNYLIIDSNELRFRLYSVQGVVPWEEIREVSSGAGWPSLTFHDCGQVGRRFDFIGLAPLGWILSVPTGFVSLVIRRPLAHIYPATRRQLVNGFRANEQMFGFHYGLPTSLLEGTTLEMLAAMRRHRSRGRR